MRNLSGHTTKQQLAAYSHRMARARGYLQQCVQHVQVGLRVTLLLIRCTIQPQPRHGRRPLPKPAQDSRPVAARVPAHGCCVESIIHSTIAKIVQLHRQLLLPIPVQVPHLYQHTVLHCLLHKCADLIYLNFGGFGFCHACHHLQAAQSRRTCRECY